MKITYERIPAANWPAQEVYLSQEAFERDYKGSVLKLARMFENNVSEIASLTLRSDEGNLVGVHNFSKGE